MKKLLAACAATILLSPAVLAREPAHQFLQVQLSPSLNEAASGRLLVFAQPLAAAKAAAKDKPITKVDTDLLNVEATNIAAKDIVRIAPGETVEIDLDDIAFPAPYSSLAPGSYVLQAVLDVGQPYTYGGRGDGDLVSKVVEVKFPLEDRKPIVLEDKQKPFDLWSLPAPMISDKLRADWADAKPSVEKVDLTSQALSKFWGRPMTMRAWVVLPPGYAADAKRTYPTVWYTHGFGGDLERLQPVAAQRYAAMRDGKAPKMIWVLLDQSSPSGPHEFVDSVNNGPHETALVTELMPALQAKYRMDAKPSGRFLNGHSSGGWATLWLMMRQPRLFGGTWSTAPDPVDFHDFTGVDLTSGENFYRRNDGTLRPLVRMTDGDGNDKVIATQRSFALYEEALADHGGQMRAFEWVFSPRDSDGRPQQLFNRASGDVNASVAAHWRANYDIARLIETNWPRLKKDLDGKIHVIVGTKDTFYLDGAVHRLDAVMQSLGAKADFRYLPGKTHFNLYAKGDENFGLLNDFAWEMHAIARPKEKRPN